MRVTKQWKKKKKGLKYFKQKQIRRSCRSFSPTGKNDGVAGVYKTWAGIEKKMLRFYFIKKAQSLDVFWTNIFFQTLVLLSLKNRNPYSNSVVRAAAVLAPQAVSPDVAHYRFSFFIIVFLFSHMVIHKLSVIWGDGGGPCQCVCRLPGWYIWIKRRHRCVW